MHTIKFKVGDRVKCIKSRDGYEAALGKVGKVTDISNGGLSVEFDEKLGNPGQYDGGFHDKYGKSGYVVHFMYDGISPSHPNTHLDYASAFSSTSSKATLRKRVISRMTVEVE